MNVPSVQLHEAPPIAVDATVKLGASAPFGGSTSEWSAFLSLITGFLDEIATATKETKTIKKEETPAPRQLAGLVPEGGTAMMTIAYDAAMPGLPFSGTRWTDSSSSSSGAEGASMPFPQLVPEPFRSGVSLVAAQTDPAFTLRLTPKHAAGGSELPGASRATEVLTDWTSHSQPQPAKQTADEIPPALPDDFASVTELHRAPVCKLAEPGHKAIEPARASRLALPNPILQPAGSTETKSDNALLAPEQKGKNLPQQETPRKPPQRSPIRESGVPQPQAEEAKPETAARLDVHLQLHDKQGEANPSVQTPAPAAGRVDVQAARPPAPGNPPPKLATDPEVKALVPPPLARQISLKLSGDSTRVNVEVSERAGKIQVSVRTPDHELTRSLQTELGELVGRLESKGFKTETWVPPVTHGPLPPQGANSGSATGQEQSGDSASGRGSGEQRQGQNDSNQRQQGRWAAALEKTLSATETRSESQ